MLKSPFGTAASRSTAARAMNQTQNQLNNKNPFMAGSNTSTYGNSGNTIRHPSQSTSALNP